MLRENSSRTPKAPIYLIIFVTQTRAFTLGRVGFFKHLMVSSVTSQLLIFVTFLLFYFNSE